MADDRMRRIEENLHSLEEFRQRAIAEGNEGQAARAEQGIILLEGQVSEFMMDLVRQGTAAQAPEGSQGSAEQASTKRQHILAINGDPDFLNILRTLLQDARYNVTTTNFVPESFDVIDALQPALLIVDLVIGEREGWDLLERLHREAGTRGIPVIAVSWNDEELDRVRWDEEKYGTRRVLRKPLNLHALLDTIAELIGTA
jgi:two-component system, OmpR family, response regulator VicR